jgi:hypothetical protein
MNFPRAPASAMYMRSLKDPNITIGGVLAVSSATSALSVFDPAFRATAKAQGRPISSSRKFWMPRT